MGRKDCLQEKVYRREQAVNQSHCKKRQMIVGSKGSTKEVSETIFRGADRLKRTSMGSENILILIMVESL